jgi:sugar lactone lactonase YvrE
MTAGHIYTVAGGGTGGLGDGGPATSAVLDLPEGVAVGTAGNLVIADNNDNRVRVVAARTGTFFRQRMTAGNIYTIAAPPAAGGSPFGPAAVAVDAAGNVVVADAGQDRVWVVADHTGTFYGQAMRAGKLYAVAGTGTVGFAGDGGPATSAELNGPAGVAVDAAGNLVVSDLGNNRVRVVAASTGTFYGQPMTAEDIYTIAGNGTQGFAGDGGPATGAELHAPGGVAVDAAGDVLVADQGNWRIRAVAASTGTFYGRAMTAGNIYTIAGNGDIFYSGNGRPATSAQFGSLPDVALGAAGNMLIADQENDRVRVVAGSTGTFYGQAMTAGNIYTVAGNGLRGFSGDGRPATRAKLSSPDAVAADAAGNLLIADSANNRVRVVADSTGSFYGRSMTAGNIYTIAGNGRLGFSGDGGPATKAKLAGPAGLAVDAFGNVLIAAQGNQRIRVVAGRTGPFYGQPMIAGNVYTIAGGGLGPLGDGGPATSATLADPTGVATDFARNVLIADVEHSRIRVVAESSGTFYGQTMTAGNIYTIAGNGTRGYTGDGGPSTGAELDLAAGVAGGPAGGVVIGDTLNSVIRMVAGSNGMFYGQTMTAGNIYTIAGNGTGGFAGDGGPATSAELSDPGGVALDNGGNVLFADGNNNRIREVTP